MIENAQKKIPSIEILKGEILYALSKHRYLACWSIAAYLGYPPADFGGCGTPGPGDKAIRELMIEGIIEELPDLGCRYRLVAQRQDAAAVEGELEYLEPEDTTHLLARIATLEAAQAAHHQALATVEAMLADCQRQAAALARDAGLTVEDMTVLKETAQALRAIGRRPKLAGQVDALLGRLEAADSEASDVSKS